MLPQADVIALARAQGRLQLTEAEAKALVAAEGAVVTMPRPARSAEEAARLAAEAGFPVAMKVDSPDIIHKSDAGGVRLGLTDSEQVVRAFREMLAEVPRRAPTARILGVTVQPMARPGVEVIVGASRDPQFGPVVMFGLGGLFVEVLRDVSFRVVPLSRWDAGEMIRGLKGFLVLKGARGAPPVDLDALGGLLLTVSGLMERRPELAALDLNPVLAYSDGAVAVDARATLVPAAGGVR